MKIRFDEIIVHLTLLKPWNYENIREFNKLFNFFIEFNWYTILLLSCVQHRYVTFVYTVKYSLQ